MHAKSLQSCLTPCDPMDGSPPDSIVHGILQARILEWVVISFCSRSHFVRTLQSCPPPGDLPDTGIEPASLRSLALASEFFTTNATSKAGMVYKLEGTHQAAGIGLNEIISCMLF